jgi:hypothetical protein
MAARRRWSIGASQRQMKARALALVGFEDEDD